jgi:hypothetical protein
MRGLGRATLAIATVAAGAAAACTSASGEVTGGATRFDLAVPCFRDPYAMEEEDLVDAGSGARWSDLYRDLFGPTGGASCAGQGNCHGEVGRPGEAASGFLCDTEEGCRESMLGASGLVPESALTAPASARLFGILRHRDECGISGRMPAGSSYVFSKASLERIRTWIVSEAPND